MKSPFNFRKKKAPKGAVFDQALGDMTQLAHEAADAVALLSPMSLADLKKTEAAVIDQVISNVRTQWLMQGNSEAFMEAILPPIEKRFRKSFHDRLFAVVTIDQSVEGQA